ncbi:flagellar hook capping protein [Sulfurimonas lithotrophica]|uniref:Basal-body rod modification protein FlgD n=1 Tax=Sulfurimonas lithotrophica TaxID=2590022 RepID=A0A5P8P3P2_9BACT|nr:flagellar hook capping FlgD N-terminal domain-containing protein [Sulfurimonas lithotrophica]QFR50352.1 flagellar hook capping protein [Sulfurimonas lithotrophica]
MAINSVGENLATNGAYNDGSTNGVEDKTALGKDDFMTLLLVELQHQDPTEPMDSEKILTQTSQLAALESAENTNKALEELAASLSNSQQFATVSAIGKTADLGSNAIAHDEGDTTSFEVYFPESIASGEVEILDSEGNIVATVPIELPKDENGDIAESIDSGVYQFDWDGTLTSGDSAGSGVYYVTASYTDAAGNSQTTRMGAYPIESIRFEDGDTLVKVGSNYVSLSEVQEVY